MRSRLELIVNWWLRPTFNGFCEHLLPLFSSKSQIVENHLLDIINQSLELDKQFVRQVAHISWKFASTPSPFNPDTMTLEGGQKHTGDGQVTLVLAPALVRSDKSSGDGYNITTDLMKMEVICEPQSSGMAPESSHRRGKGKGHG